MPDLANPLHLARKLSAVQTAADDAKAEQDALALALADAKAKVTALEAGK